MDLNPAIPVICAACHRSLGADEPEHAELAELLSFPPVPVRAHCNNWTPAHQRGFIAALAITGSVNKAARAVGRYPFGAERLRKARGGTGFAIAWDAALDLCHQRELAIMGGDLRKLEEEARADALRARSVFVRGRDDRASLRARPSDDDALYDETSDQDYAEAQERIAMRLRNARTAFLLTHRHDAKRRRAWELLVGPVDWDRVGEDRGILPGDRDGMPVMRDASMVVPTQAGMLPELTGEEAHPAIRFFTAIGKAADDLTEEERTAITAHAEMLRDTGWEQREDGSWTKPATADPEPTSPRPRQPQNRARKREAQNPLTAPASASSNKERANMPRRAAPAIAEQRLTPTQMIAAALASASLPPRPEAPGVRHYRLNSAEADEALHDPEKRRPGYIVRAGRPPLADEVAKEWRPKDAAERRLARKRPRLG